MGRSPIYKGRIVDLGLEDVVLPNGAKVQLEVIRHRGASAIVPLHDDRTVTLVHQFRHAAGGMIWEVPAGVLDGGEAPETCAARELREEVQLEARTLTPIGSILTTPGFTDERIHLFLAEGALRRSRRARGRRVHRGGAHAVRAGARVDRGRHDRRREDDLRAASRGESAPVATPMSRIVIGQPAQQPG
jgi:ADP-ribose pyrophosphatase